MNHQWETLLDSYLHFGHSAALRELGSPRADGLDEAAQAHFRTLESSAPHFKDMFNNACFQFSVPILALYRALRQEMELDEAAALRLLEEMIRDAYRGTTGFGRTIMLNAMYGVKPLRRLLIHRMTSTEEQDGFRVKEVHSDDAEVAFDILQCPNLIYAKRMGAPEIVPILCRMDELDAEKLWGHEFRRAGTLSMGAERCDFRYIATQRT